MHLFGNLSSEMLLFDPALGPLLLVFCVQHSFFFASERFFFSSSHGAGQGASSFSDLPYCQIDTQHIRAGTGADGYIHAWTVIAVFPSGRIGGKGEMCMPKENV